MPGQRRVKITDVTLGNILVPNLSNTCYESLPTLGMPKKSDIGTKPTRDIDVIGKQSLVLEKSNPDSLIDWRVNS